MSNTDQKIASLIKEFCLYLIQLAPEFQELAQARWELENDLQSKQLWDEIEERKATITLLKSQGLPVSFEQESALAEKLKKMRENPITFRYLKALNRARKIAGQIGEQMRQEVGIDFTPKKNCK